MTFVAVALIVTFLALSGLHVYWAGGGTWGFRVAIPEVDGKPALHPSPAVTIVVAELLGVAAVIVALAAHLVSLAWAPFWVVRVGAYGLAVVFAARTVGDFRTFGFAKRVHGTAFARNDTRIYSPLCAFIAAGSAFVAASA